MMPPLPRETIWRPTHATVRPTRAHGPACQRKWLRCYASSKKHGRRACPLFALGLHALRKIFIAANPAQIIVFLGQLLSLRRAFTRSPGDVLDLPEVDVVPVRH